MWTECIIYSTDKYLFTRWVICWMLCCIIQRTTPARIYLLKVNSRSIRTMWNRFKVSNKNTRTTSLTPYLYRYFWTYFTPFSCLPTVDVEQVKFFLGRYFSWIYSAQRSVYYSIVSLDEFERVTVCGEVNMIQPIKAN